LNIPGRLWTPIAVEDLRFWFLNPGITSVSSCLSSALDRPSDQFLSSVSLSICLCVC